MQDTDAIADNTIRASLVSKLNGRGGIRRQIVLGSQRRTCSKCYISAGRVSSTSHHVANISTSLLSGKMQQRP